MFCDKRINIITGHYGTGKTNIAVNLAFDFKDQGYDVIIADLDIVNPYYRSADFRNQLENAGIKVLTTNFANTNLDIPSLPAEIFSIFSDKKKKVILDIGGDDAGAMVLGRFRDYILEDDYEMFYVINEKRSMSCDFEENLNLLGAIENVTGLEVSRIINNTHLCSETTEKIILDSMDFTKKFCEISKKEYGFSCIEEKFYNNLVNEIDKPYKVKIYNKLDELI